MNTLYQLRQQAKLPIIKILFWAPVPGYPLQLLGFGSLCLRGGRYHPSHNASNISSKLQIQCPVLKTNTSIYLIIFYLQKHIFYSSL
jgi:hypothetical protein